MYGLVLLSLSAGLVTGAGAVPENRPVALVHATVHDGNGGLPLRDGTVLVVGERITCVGKANLCKVPRKALRLNLTGKHLTPGLIDSHVHFAQTGWVDGRPDMGLGTTLYDYEGLQRAIREKPERWHRAWLCSGITAVYDTGGYPWTLSYPAQTEHDPRRAHVRAAGPLLQLQQMPGRQAMGEQNFWSISTDEEAVAQVRRLAALGAQAVKFRYLDPPADQAEAMARRAKLIGAEADRVGLPLIVHATQLRNAKIALDAGAELLVHSVADEFVDDEFVRKMKERGTILVSTLLVGPHWTQMFAGVVFGSLPAIDDPNGCIDQDTRSKLLDVAKLRTGLPAERSTATYAYGLLQRGGETLAREKANLRRLHREGITIATGTDAGNALTFHGPSIYAEMEAIEAAGISPNDILVLSTRNGARAMGRTDIGTITVGNVADMLILRDDPLVSAKAFRSVETVIRAGVPHSVKSLAATKDTR